MTQINQDFTLYQGDAGAPLFTVLDGAGLPLNLSNAADIIWNVARNATSVPVLIKKMSVSGGITLVTDGSDGKFQVNLSNLDTSVLSGFYLHEALLIDGAGDQSTVSTGRVQVGRLPAWSYSGDPANSTTDAVRFLIGDTDAACPQLEDPEIDFAYNEMKSIYGAAVICCRSLSSAMSRLADQSSGQSKLSYSQRARAYSARAAEYEKVLVERGGIIPYIGGISVTDMQNNEADTDRVQPEFSLGMYDNSIPVPETGNEPKDQPETPAF